MKQKIEAVKEQLNDVYHQLEQANETISLLSEQLEDVTADVETELKRIIDYLNNGLELEIDDEATPEGYISSAIADLTKLVEAI